MMKNLNYFMLLFYGYWPFLASMSLLNFIFSIFIFMKFYFLSTLMISLYLMLVNIALWFMEFGVEGFKMGLISEMGYKSMKWSMSLFILSEIMLFFSFFWAYFDFMLSPGFELGGTWPPFMLVSLKAFKVPLLNTLILVMSSVLLTMAHFMMNNKMLSKSFNYIIVTISLGAIFSMFQYLEYKYSYFSLSDSSFGSVFYMLTGLHGLHVLIGTVLLINCAMSMENQGMQKSTTSFELSSWYWHFVDIVWLYVFMFLYYLNN